MGISSIVIVLLVGVAAVSALPRKQQRIVGGSITLIEAYPYASSLLYSWDLVNYWQSCGGTIITKSAVLSAAHCFYGDTAINWRIRIGSSWANSGGSIHNVNQIKVHSNFNYFTIDNDVAILRAATNFVYSNRVQPASIAGANYNLPDNQVVWAIGWGTTSFGGPASEQLRHVQIWTINQTICKNRYAMIGANVTDNMLCSGWLDVGGRDQCQGDSGGPLIHNSVIVGVCSWGQQCALASYPGVNTRVSRYTSWIQANV